MLMNDRYLRCFRYGREDEELMGLRFCNEVIVAAEQIYPTPVEEAIDSEANAGSPKRRASTSRRNSTLVNNQGFVAVPFVVDMGSAAPPSIRLIPCRPYNGAPIGEQKASFIEFVAQKVCSCAFKLPGLMVYWA